MNGEQLREIIPNSINLIPHFPMPSQNWL